MVRERNRDVALAWHTAALTRTEKLPKLERLLISVGKKKPQTVDQMKQALASIFGPPKQKPVHA
jgi:hypothetical protein